jgi:drug/metabolite transporter (DMT)-like permease
MARVLWGQDNGSAAGTHQSQQASGETMRIHNVSGYLFALLATVIWSGNFIVARGLAQEIAPVSLAFFRWLTASAVLLPFALPSMIRQRREILANLGHLVPTALLGVTLFNTLIYIAGHQTTALNLSLIAVFTPVFIVILARIVLSDPITWGRLCGILLAVSGVVTLATNGDWSSLAGLEFNGGDLWMLLATLLFATYTILVRRKPASIEPTAYLGATFLLGLFMLAPWAAWEWSSSPPSIPPMHVIGSILYIGVGASLVSFLFWNRAVSIIGPAKAGVVYYSLPLFCGVEAWLILGEEIAWLHGVAGLLIITGILLATRVNGADPEHTKKR